METRTSVTTRYWKVFAISAHDLHAFQNSVTQTVENAPKICKKRIFKKHERKGFWKQCGRSPEDINGLLIL